ncbi:hypothetical protein Ddye_011791 [Dipteronia dyeriana]|uniref:DUF659 domain-containing protein n=1 Tax=Dipteronia dyeriana TaxID=168575 RepID=A0AAD9X393_9ROSI|nr:hypothetical protein Ddye_011791 [Dipteronia dyeriana]
MLRKLWNGVLMRRGHLPPKDAKEASKLVTLDVRRSFENGIPFNVAMSPSFVSMCRLLRDYGRGCKAPIPHDLSSWVLQTEVETTRTFFTDVKKTWKATRVTIMSDGWIDIIGKNLLNFLVNNFKGTMFLKSIDASDAKKDVELVFKLLDSVVEEVGKDIIVQGREVSNYICNHGWVLALMRKHTKRELIPPTATRFAISYLTLRTYWWSIFGHETPELNKFAVKVPSHTCAASGCDKDEFNIDEWMVGEGNELGDGNQRTSSKKRNDPPTKDKGITLTDEDDE